MTERCKTEIVSGIESVSAREKYHVKARDTEELKELMSRRVHSILSTFYLACVFAPMAEELFS